MGEDSVVRLQKHQNITKLVKSPEQMDVKDVQALVGALRRRLSYLQENYRGKEDFRRVIAQDPWIQDVIGAIGKLQAQNIEKALTYLPDNAVLTVLKKTIDNTLFKGFLQYTIHILR